MEPTWVCARSPAYMLLIFSFVPMGLLTIGVGPFACSWEPFPAAELPRPALI